MHSQTGLSFNHMGIYVHDLDAMESFYTGVLGFTVTDRGSLQGPVGPVELVFLSRDPRTHHQIVLASGRPEKLEFNPINQISLAADSLATLRQVYHLLVDRGARDIDAITHGNAVSFYVRDPEGNRLELFFDTPWYVSQPMKVPVDLELPDDELLAVVEKHARSLPGFCSRTEWEKRMHELMNAS
ncbi:VOC family protein [Pseudomonas sp. TWI929]|uniref:VOC family protein n=1 Tax=Pseudomonas sp. TWI929 TaxID=3136795 RepID=UPI0032088F8F